MAKTTMEAFQEVISQRGIHHQLGLADSTVRIWRMQLKSGKGGPTIDRMEEVLKQAGYQVVQEKLWIEKSKK